MKTVLVEAIKNRHRLTIYYHPGMRVIEPHAYGESAEGNELLRAFQVSGASESGQVPDWKLFRIDAAGQITKRADQFPGPRPGYRRSDKAMKGGIFAQL